MAGGPGLEPSSANWSRSSPTASSREVRASGGSPLGEVAAPGLPGLGGRSLAGLLVELPAARSVTLRAPPRPPWPRRLPAATPASSVPPTAWSPGPLEKLEVRPVGESGAINEELRARRSVSPRASGGRCTILRPPPRPGTRRRLPGAAPRSRWSDRPGRRPPPPSPPEQGPQQQREVEGCGDKAISDHRPGQRAAHERVT
jgi:hypothetical protein